MGSICNGCNDEFCSFLTIQNNVQRLCDWQTVECIVKSSEQVDLWASSGCLLAEQAVQAFIPKRWRHTHHRWRFRLAHLTSKGEVKIIFQREDRHEQADLRLISIRKEGQDKVDCYWAMFTFADDPAAQYIKARPRDPNPASTQNFQLVKSWIEECFSEHSSCSKSDAAGSSLPTRVIDVAPVDGVGEPRLYVSQGEKASYVTLSYCWGAPQPFCTTKSTLESKLVRLPMGDLPQTIRDAILVTRKLGVRYLWVDSLCIIQDDADDKARELGGMAQIYMKSFLTISAASAWNCNLSFLYTRKSDSEIGVRIPYRCPDGILGAVYIYPAREFDMDGGLDLQGVLTEIRINSRAWCYQERLLSPRVVSFRHDGIQWKCITKMKSDDDLKDEQLYLSKTPTIGIDKLSPLFFSGNDKSIPLDLSEEIVEELHRDWNIKIAEYAKRELSVPNDRLPGLSGVAAEFSRVLGDTYLAGLWKSHLVCGFFWYVPEHPQHHNAQRVGILQSARKPSWSWAAVNGPVLYVDSVETRSVSRQLQILACETTLLSALAPFGEVTGGYLTIRAPVRQISSERAVKNFSGFTSLHWDPRRPYKMGMIYLDRGNPCRSNHEILWFLELQDEEDEKKFGPWGLVLVEIDKDQSSFERVGLFNLTKGLLEYQDVVKAGQNTNTLYYWEDSEKSNLQTLQIY